MHKYWCHDFHTFSIIKHIKAKLSSDCGPWNQVLSHKGLPQFTTSLLFHSTHLDYITMSAFYFESDNRKMCISERARLRLRVAQCWQQGSMRHFSPRIMQAWKYLKEKSFWQLTQSKGEPHFSVSLSVRYFKKIVEASLIGYCSGFISVWSY